MQLRRCRDRLPPVTSAVYRQRPLSRGEWAKVVTWATSLEALRAAHTGQRASAKGASPPSWPHTHPLSNPRPAAAPKLQLWADAAARKRCGTFACGTYQTLLTLRRVCSVLDCAYPSLFCQVLQLVTKNAWMMMGCAPQGHCAVIMLRGSTGALQTTKDSMESAAVCTTGVAAEPLAVEDGGRAGLQEKSRQDPRTPSNALPGLMNRHAGLQQDTAQPAPPSRCTELWGDARLASSTMEDACGGQPDGYTADACGPAHHPCLEEAVQRGPADPTRGLQLLQTLAGRLDAATGQPAACGNDGSGVVCNVPSFLLSGSNVMWVFSASLHKDSPATASVLLQRQICALPLALWRGRARGQLQC